VSEWIRAGELNEADLMSDAAKKNLEHDRVSTLCFVILGTFALFHCCYKFCSSSSILQQSVPVCTIQSALLRQSDARLLVLLPLLIVVAVVPTIAHSFHRAVLRD
jgi:hypothetical protein